MLNASKLRCLVWCVVALTSATQADDAFHFDRKDRELVVRYGEQPVATYVWDDEKIKRPYFTHLRTLHGTRVSRNHPPLPDHDAVDHDTMHPGLWLAFGDLNGQDFWRNKSIVEQVKFAKEPKSEGNHASFAVLHRYLANDGSEVCQEAAQFRFTKLPSGWALDWQSVFHSDKHDLSFGQQEEMGLGIRMATPLTVDSGRGSILNDRGERNGSGTWGKECEWLDYSGQVDAQMAGILVVPHRTNARKCWAHSRDYGLMVLNPFPRPQDNIAPQRTNVPKGDEFRLRFSIFVHEADKDQPLDLSKVAATMAAE